jgi:hypothetical protein
VAGDDEMLRTGFYDGTPLEGGKIADSHPVDLVAEAPDSQSSQQQQQTRGRRPTRTSSRSRSPSTCPRARGAWRRRRTLLLRRRRMSSRAAGRMWLGLPPVDVAWEWDARIIKKAVD